MRALRALYSGLGGAVACTLRGGSTAAVLVCDGRVCGASEAPAAPAALLRAAPPGAYTVARTWHRTRLVDWDRHVARLAESLQLLRAQAGNDAPPPLDAAGVSAAITPSVRAALRAAQPLLPGTPPSAELMLTVLLALAPPAEGPAVTVHVCALPPPHAGPVAAAVQGAGRPLARAKTSAWVAARAPLEAARPADCAETVLSDAATGALLEGTVSNFFVVTADDASDPASPPVLQTAAVREGVLPGVSRGALLRLAQRAGLPVREAAPARADAPAWREAFLCNALRGVTPLRELRWLPAPDWAQGAHAPPPPPPRRFPDAPGPVTARLAAAYDAALPAALSPDFVSDG